MIYVFFVFLCCLLSSGLLGYVAIFLPGPVVCFSFVFEDAVSVGSNSAYGKQQVASQDSFTCMSVLLLSWFELANQISDS